jgi:hypothetical protein
LLYAVAAAAVLQTMSIQRLAARVVALLEAEQVQHQRRPLQVLQVVTQVAAHKTPRVVVVLEVLVATRRVLLARQVAQEKILQHLRATPQLLRLAAAGVQVRPQAVLAVQVSAVQAATLQEQRQRQTRLRVAAAARIARAATAARAYFTFDGRSRTWHILQK